MAVQTIVSEEVIDLNVNYLKLKRLFDIFFTLLIFIPLSLVIVVVALLICLDSHGPIFYRQKRVGQDGVEFEMYKFRTMYTNSDQALHRDAAARYILGEKLNTEATSTNPYKLHHDPRITRIGRILRKTSFDELPQFFNVLRGQMSLVGPRPPMPYEVELYSARDSLRLAGLPGLTGTWQVYGRSRVDFKDMIEMDIEYLRSQSLRQDLKLIALTVPVMVLSRGGA